MIKYEELLNLLGTDFDNLSHEELGKRVRLVLTLSSLLSPERSLLKTLYEYGPLPGISDEVDWVHLGPLVSKGLAVVTARKAGQLACCTLLGEDAYRLMANERP